ncbi:hypothetical protein [uncultured Chryseobacterium sp.]|uniref:hypothetical protein n=1 Tax=uncultured Chryseobacterium sp. TaxID=259322 RepID=UPI0025D9794D|nr:hypothetical protein [uncultured Chryseobacterium sp.]
MAAAQCYISFEVHFTTSNPIQKAMASYKNKSLSSTVPYTDTDIPLPSVPYNGTSLSVSLPDIQDQGDYDLVITLTDSNGFIAKKSGTFKIGNCSGNTPPKVSIRWRDNSGTEERFCTSSCPDYTISVESSDANNDIVKREVFISQDNGGNWTSYIPDLSTSTIFNTGTLSTAGKRLFKVTVTDSAGNAATSNMLSYTKQQEITKFYKKNINGIDCVSNGNGPTNYDVWCTARENFSLSDSNLTGISTGFIRLIVDGGTSEIGLSKATGAPLMINQVLPITSVLTVSYAAAGQNPPEAYPHGYPANVSPSVYRFEFSADGTTNWSVFDFSLDD